MDFLGDFSPLQYRSKEDGVLLFLRTVRCAGAVGMQFHSTFLIGTFAKFWTRYLSHFWINIFFASFLRWKPNFPNFPNPRLSFEGLCTVWQGCFANITLSRFGEFNLLNDYMCRNFVNDEDFEGMLLLLERDEKADELQSKLKSESFTKS